jgi:hypothetical protein
VSQVIDYIIGADRNNPDEARAHMYAKTAAGHLWPMCDYGWNRSDGERFSILRGWGSARGVCKLCERNIEQGKRPVIKPRPQKTRWL